MKFKLIVNVLLALTVAVLFPAAAFAQDQMVKLSGERITLAEAFDQIEQQTDLSIDYDAASVDASLIVSAPQEKGRVSDILGRLLDGTGYTYSFNRSHVIVSVQKHTEQEPADRTVTGEVRDMDGQPVIGASVILAGTSTGTVTDLDGKFTIPAPEDGILRFSSIGYRTVDVSLNGREVLSVTMPEDNLYLDEVVVVGYGTQKKVNLTGAVDQISSEAFAGRPTANMTQMLQGAVPNLNIKFTDGRPNSSPGYNIRGTTSIGQGGSALVLIDGVEGDASLINPNDIESVSVLKDAASSAVYGSRAPYGVVLITTKNASKGKPTVTYSANFTFGMPVSVPDVVTDGYTYAEHFYTAWYNKRHTTPSGINNTMEFSTAWLNEYGRRAETGNYEILVSDGSLGTAGHWVYFVKGTDYYDLLYKDFSFSQTHNISISGSDDRFDYYASMRYFDNNGIFDSDVNPESYRVFNGRMKMGYQVTPWLKISNNTDIARSRYITPELYAMNTSNIWRNIADAAFPCSTLWNPDGTMTYSAVYSVGDFLYGKSKRTYDTDQLNTTFRANATFLDGRLKINADFTYRVKDFTNSVRKVPTEYSQIEGVVGTVSGLRSYIREGAGKYDNIVTNEYVEFEDTFAGRHYFKALLGYNYEQQTYKYTEAYNDDLLTGDVENIQLAMGTDNRQVAGDWHRWRNAGAFARINYSYDDRYLIELNGRYDGSSKFPPRQRWAFFPSVSLGWRVTEEPWFRVDKKDITNIKVRASYGSLGNSNVGNYAYNEIFGFDSGRIIDGKEALYTQAPSPIPASLTWETARTFDVGLDLAFFDGRLTFTGDYYIRRTLNMYTVGPTLPDVYGASSPKGNYAEMTTRGYELILTWNDSFMLGGKPFSYGIKATLADYYSIIDKYNNATGSLSTSNTNYNYYEGMRIGEIWGYVSNGLWQTQDEIDIAEANAKAHGQEYYNPLMSTSDDYRLYPGDIKFEDLNGNGYIDRGSNTVDDPGDRRVIGNSEPRYIYSFGIDLEWNNIYLSAFFQGVGKQDWYPSNESMFWGQYNRPYNNMPTWHVGNYWTEDNRDAYLPRYTGYYGPFYNGNYFANTRYLQDVSYIRLKNLQIGYTIPQKLTRKAKIDKVTVFFSGENLWTWSPVYRYTRDIDVTANIYGTDSISAADAGDGFGYPTMKSYSIGLNITF